MDHQKDIHDDWKSIFYLVESAEPFSKRFKFTIEKLSAGNQLIVINNVYYYDLVKGRDREREKKRNTNRIWLWINRSKWSMMMEANE